MSVIKFNAVSKRFEHHPALLNPFGHERRGALTVLRNISLEIQSGIVFVLVGPNGSGKTTFLKLVSTLLLPDDGAVEVDSFDTARQGNHVRHRVGIAVPNERSFYPRLTARENLAFFATLENIPRRDQRQKIDALLETVDLSASADVLAMKFSSGMYQRLAIARALLKNPSVLLLDEPSRSLDPGSAERFWELVRQTRARGTTILVASHHFDEVEAIGDRVAVLNQGSLAGISEVKNFAPGQLRRWYFDELKLPDPAAYGSANDAR